MLDGNIQVMTDVLSIRGLNAPLDLIAVQALSAMTMEEIYRGKTDELRNKINVEGLSDKIESLSKRLNSRQGLTDTQRVLLSTQEVYASLILNALDRGIKPEDTSGLANSILRELESAKDLFYSHIMILAFERRGIQIESGFKLTRIVELLQQRNLPVLEGQVWPAFSDLLGIIHREGDIPEYVEHYVNKFEVSGGTFTPTIKQAMVEYLLNLGVVFPPIPKEIDETYWKQWEDDGKYDEYFALAYNEALHAKSGRDPIDGINRPGQVTSWDFDVDHFAGIEDRGINPTNIKAAGALDYIYRIGEELQVFNVASALILRWSTGSLDITQGQTAAALYRFYKLRSDRTSPAERAMLYKRVFNIGQAQLLSKMTVNEAFPKYWHALMSEAAQYIKKAESSSRGESQVSRASIYQATRTLQHNLSEAMTGMTHLQVTEDYAHLKEALDLIKSEEILDHFGGRDRSMWSVIELVALEDLGQSVQTATTRTLAVEGNKIFLWIANFDQGTVTDEAFENFLSAAEAWILAQASMQESSNGRYSPNGQNGHDPDFDDFDAEFEESGDFDDWDL